MQNKTYSELCFIIINFDATLHERYGNNCSLILQCMFLLGRHGSASLRRDGQENKMAATYNVLAFKR